MSEPTVREMLEGAAKACDISAKEWVGSTLRLIDGTCWDPRTCIEDCFKMETALEIEVKWCLDRVRAVVILDRVVEGSAYYSDYGGDKNLARMAASLQCAYKVGTGAV